ncbi:hypothetical protein, partial [Vibrio parahaemolyticus]|uniref:hypothetical protein n=1 Tax=Vibrio parahaemolyticus TaxID=670 RepID=UPI0021126080
CHVSGGHIYFITPIFCFFLPTFCFVVFFFCVLKKLRTINPPLCGGGFFKGQLGFVFTFWGFV